MNPRLGLTYIVECYFIIENGGYYYLMGIMTVVMYKKI